MAQSTPAPRVDVLDIVGTVQANGDVVLNGHSAPAVNGMKHSAPLKLVPQDLLPVLQDFKDYVESDRRLYLYFNQMWAQSLKQRSFPGHVTVQNYDQMWQVLNQTLRSTPTWTPEVHHVGSAGLPICDMFYYAVATPSGYAAFTDPGVTQMLKKLLNYWGDYLSSSESAYALGSWMHESEFSGNAVLCAVANAPLKTQLRFEELFECDPSKPNYGYSSWDEFFVRRYREGVRPVASPEDDNVIANACESKSYNLARNVKYYDRFWIKGNAYSLYDMLKRDDLPWAFVGGTVYQAFLSPYSYHRWHAPVSGVIRHAYALEGTYFTIPEFHSIDSRAHREDEDINVEEWQAWLACQATRGIITIEADNSALGLVGFVAIGMVEVSSIDITVRPGQRVRKGDELGMFHFGGSSHCLLFQRGVDVVDFPRGPPERPENFPVNGPVARLRTATS